MNKKIDRNYLEIFSLSELNETKNPSNEFVLELIDPPNFQLNKFFYKEIGKNHRWVDRLIWNDKEWIEYTTNNSTKTYILKKENDNGKENSNLFELIFLKIKLAASLTFIKPGI